MPVKFAAFETTPWLPSSATVHVRFDGGEAHDVHRYSDYRVDGSERAAGEAAGPVGMADDALGGAS